MDVIDQANEQIERGLAMTLLARQSRPRLNHIEDGQGNRICIDCEVQIPLSRIIAIDAVRCVKCQAEREG